MPDNGQGNLFDPFDDDPTCPSCPHPPHRSWCPEPSCRCYAQPEATWEPREHTPRDGTETQDDAAHSQRSQADIRINLLWDRYTAWLLADPGLFWQRVEAGAIEWEFLEVTNSPTDDGWRQRVGDLRNKRGWLEWRPLAEHLQTGPKVRYVTRRFHNNGRMTGNVSYITGPGAAEMARRHPGNPLLRRLVERLREEKPLGSQRFLPAW